MDYLEAELRTIASEIDDMRQAVVQAKAQLETIGGEQPGDNPEMARFQKERAQIMELTVTHAEGRIRSREERKAEVQAELDKVLRSTSKLEAMLEDWVAEQ